MAVLLAANAMAATSFENQPKFFRDDPIWQTPAPVPVKNITSRKLSDYYDFFEYTLFHPGDWAPKPGESQPSMAINTVDEVPDSAWYTNRHAHRPMTLAELMRGAGDSRSPAPGGFTVIAAKNEGITPGFVIQDASGRKYVVKFDPLSNPEMASAADVITSKFFYALGYNVPENYIFYFDRSQVTIAANTQIKDEHGKKRAIRAQDVDDMLAKVPRMADGRYRALASFYIAGKPLGPFRYHGTRPDDPNDLVPHEHRRDVRALRTFGAWLGHDDSKDVNTLDMLVEQDGVSFVKHYLIDFGATLGSASFEANSPRSGNNYLFAWKPAAAQFATFGLYVPKWQHAKYPKLPATGRFEYEVFDPEKWVPEYPNTAFHNENVADRAWAARKIAAFTDEEIRAIVSTGRYSDPEAADWVTRCLIERRNKIVRAFLNGAAGLDDFTVREGRLEFRDLSAAALQIQWSVFDNRTGLLTDLTGEHSRQVPAGRPDGSYLRALIQTGRGTAVCVYVKFHDGRARVVGVERMFATNRG
jgi:hypothetical protein